MSVAFFVAASVVVTVVSLFPPLAIVVLSVSVVPILVSALVVGAVLVFPAPPPVMMPALLPVVRVSAVAVPLVVVVPVLAVRLPLLPRVTVSVELLLCFLFGLRWRLTSW